MGIKSSEWLNQEMENLEKIYPDRKDRISGMISTLEKFILDESKTPVEKSTVDKVERIVNEWKEGKNLENKYDQIMDIIRSIKEQRNQ
ncbi:MAG: hypothetical protein HXS54_14320 [Theionarchaea archaeon]|nr:hypothetical protein [Theionarchaea archaeon]